MLTVTKHPNAARKNIYVDQINNDTINAITLYLIFRTHFFSPVHAADPCHLQARTEHPEEPIEAAPGWIASRLSHRPPWISTVCFIHHRAFSNYFVLGLSSTQSCGR
jgi:hypothetical protein